MICPPYGWMYFQIFKLVFLQIHLTDILHDHQHRDPYYYYSRRCHNFAIFSPLNHMTGFRCGGDTYYVEAPMSCASSISVPIASAHARMDSSTPWVADRLLIIGIMVAAKNIIHEGAGDGGDPQNNGDHQHQIAVTDISVKFAMTFRIPVCSRPPTTINSPMKNSSVL